MCGKEGVDNPETLYDALLLRDHGAKMIVSSCDPCFSALTVLDIR